MSRRGAERRMAKAGAQLGPRQGRGNLSGAWELVTATNRWVRHDQAALRCDSHVGGFHAGMVAGSQSMPAWCIDDRKQFGGARSRPARQAGDGAQRDPSGCRRRKGLGGSHRAEGRQVGRGSDRMPEAAQSVEPGETAVLSAVARRAISAAECHNIDRRMRQFTPQPPTWMTPGACLLSPPVGPI